MPIGLRLTLADAPSCSFNVPPLAWASARRAPKAGTVAMAAAAPSPAAPPASCRRVRRACATFAVRSVMLDSSVSRLAATSSNANLTPRLDGDGVRQIDAGSAPVGRLQNAEEHGQRGAGRPERRHAITIVFDE